MTGFHWNGVGKQISGTEIIRPWSANWGPIERVAILGANGSGKSTVLQLLSGQMPPSVGTLTSTFIPEDNWPLHVSWAGPNVAPPLDLSGREWVELHGTLRSWRRSPWTYLEVDDAMWSRPLRNLSSGQRQRLLLAVAVCTDAPLLLLDEPCNHLDAEGQEWFANMLRSELDAAHGSARMLVVASNHHPVEVRHCQSGLSPQGDSVPLPKF
jgi:ABC-type multidrug transport system ATPase subunit